MKTYPQYRLTSTMLGSRLQMRVGADQWNGVSRADVPATFAIVDHAEFATMLQRIAQADKRAAGQRARRAADWLREQANALPDDTLSLSVQKRLDATEGEQQ